jgi:saccharopine dehydrogenase (NAD+, L-lysine-forming)
MNNAKGIGKILIIGAGGVATVAAHKCAQLPQIFSEILLASRTLSKCEIIKKIFISDMAVTSGLRR